MTEGQITFLAKQQFEKHGLFDWHFKLNNRARALGVCYHWRKTIALATFHVLHDDDKHVMDTLLHEIAHALAGHEAGHGPKWVAVAHRIGCSPVGCQRTAQSITHQLQHKPCKWHAKCPNCGTIFRWYRTPKLEIASLYYCRKCGRDRGKITIVEGDAPRPKPIAIPVPQGPKTPQNKFSNLFNF